MPTIEVDFTDLQSLVGKELPKSIDELNEIVAYVKGEVKQFLGNDLSIEIKDSNHPDLWSTEGIARAVKGFLEIEKGLKNYSVASPSGVVINVDKRLENIRPFIGCTVVKNVQLNDTIIKGLMHLQDKLDETYGRKRKRTSIGVYEFDLITPPLTYGVSKPDETSFIPLGFDEKMTLREILERHPKGLEYGSIVKEYDLWPILKDSHGKVLSFPPVINSNDLGRVTSETKNVLIEITGTVEKTVLDAITILAASLADRGGTIHSSVVNYPYGNKRNIVTPEMKTSKIALSMNYSNKVLGMNLDKNQSVDLLQRARYGLNMDDTDTLNVTIPCYRLDIMHPVDIVEDIAIAYDYNRIKPVWPQQATLAGVSQDTEISSVVRELMIGFGFQEVLTYDLTNPEKIFTKMNMKKHDVVEISNPRMITHTCVRNWLLPSLMEFLSYNTHVEYPQRIFEVGYCVELDRNLENYAADRLKLACVDAATDTSFSQIASVLESFTSNLGFGSHVEETNHPSFIEGRVGKIIVNGTEVGVVGELHPAALEAWKLEVPVSAFELDLRALNLAKSKE
jgi:phenylalanyl-tRNA synthetase beta chain